MQLRKSPGEKTPGDGDATEDLLFLPVPETLFESFFEAVPETELPVRIMRFMRNDCPNREIIRIFPRKRLDNFAGDVYNKAERTKQKKFLQDI